MATTKQTRCIYDVSPRGDAWTVTRRGATRATARYASKRDAVTRARELARRHALAQLVIRRRDGSIESEATYGRDPFPPTG